jgi:hypothetical protein
MRDTIELAREANLAKYGDGLREGVAAFINALARFEALVRADEREICTNAAMAAAEEAVNFAMALEREACAKLCETLVMGKHCAAAIRARGNT